MIFDINRIYMLATSYTFIACYTSFEISMWLTLKGGILVMIVIIKQEDIILTLGKRHFLMWIVFSLNL